MKKLFLFAGLFLVALTIKAQQSDPTKEETIKYIDNWLKKNVEGVGNSGDMIVTKISFTEDKITIVIPSSNPSIVNTYTATGMDWSAYKRCVFNDYGGFTIFFSKKNILDEEGKYMASVIVTGPQIPEDKQQQLIKALKHLKKLSSAGNGNTFFNK
ncbi:MAG: hypothetical protein H7320_03150 [Ferruginibacter sp.]|nr:hypothetical protein [Ferruginibacter sp.]